MRFLTRFLSQTTLFQNTTRHLHKCAYYPRCRMRFNKIDAQKLHVDLKLCIPKELRPISASYLQALPEEQLKATIETSRWGSTLHNDRRIFAPFNFGFLNRTKVPAGPLPVLVLMEEDHHPGFVVERTKPIGGFMYSCPPLIIATGPEEDYAKFNELSELGSDTLEQVLEFIKEFWGAGHDDEIGTDDLLSSSDAQKLILQSMNIFIREEVLQKNIISNQYLCRPSRSFCTFANMANTGGEPDLMTGAKMVLHDWQRGRILFFVPPLKLEIVKSDEPSTSGGVANEETMVDNDRAWAAIRAIANVISSQQLKNVPVQRDLFNQNELDGEKPDGQVESEEEKSEDERSDEEISEDEKSEEEKSEGEESEEPEAKKSKQ